MDVYELFKNWINLIDETQIRKPAMSLYTKSFIEKNIKIIDEENWYELEKLVVLDHNLNPNNLSEIFEYCGIGADMRVDEWDLF